MNKLTLNDLYNMGDVLAGKIEEVREEIPNVPSDYQELVDDVRYLKNAISDGTNIPVEKELNWINAYVSAAGVVMNSQASQTCVVPMEKGEVVTIGTANSNITIIGSTTAESVAVGDRVTVIQNTTQSGAFETYTYTATDNINIVLCVVRANYNLSFDAPIYVQKEINDIAIEVTTMQDCVPSGIVEGYVLAHPVENGSFTGAGSLTTGVRNRIRTALIPYKANERIVIKNGTFQHVVGMWNGTPSASTAIRNDSTWIETEETIETSADGYIAIVFRKSDNTDILPSDFDGEIQLYNTLAYHTAVDAVGDPVPNYYVADDYLKNKASRINTLGKAGDDVFVFITDIHWELNAKHSPSLIQYLSDKCAIHKVFNGGDVSDRLMVEVYKKYRDTIKGNSYHVTGNHDWFTPNDGKALYYAMDSANNNQIGDAFGHYYYVDNVQQKIRYIILNGFTRAEGSSTITSAYSSDEIAWFTNTALNLPSTEWDVIVFTHYLRTTSISITGGADVESAIDTFNASSHTGKILAVFQGHTHWDGIYHTAGGVPVITTTCDKWDFSNEPELSQGQAGRVLGTISEQAFDVMILNRSARTFTAVRIGALAQNNIDVGRTDTGFTLAQTLEERVVSYE